jgi:hypothetical protein
MPASARKKPVVLWTAAGTAVLSSIFLKNWMTLYLGCSAPEATPKLPPLYLPQYPGGSMELATQSPCDPTKIRFEDGAVVAVPSTRTP